MAKAKNWVEYKEIKERVSLETVLERYGVKLKKSGKNWVSCCPIHGGSNPRQFSVNLEKNIFNCFGNCSTGGNVIDFVALKEFGDKEPESIRKAALMLKDWYLGDSAAPTPASKPKKRKNTKKKKKLVRKEKEKADDDGGGGGGAPERVNVPLTWELKSIDDDPEHAFFKNRKISEDTIDFFGLGLCTAGKTINGRIAIPIHNERGELLAYAGRAVSEAQLAKAKYKLPGNFVKSEVVYNLQNQVKGKNRLILVESFISVWKAHQYGFKPVVALMGSSMSEAQERLILDFLDPSGRVVLMFDADESGRKCTEECLARLSPHVFVKALDISAYAKKPHLLSSSKFKKLILNK